MRMPSDHGGILVGTLLAIFLVVIGFLIATGKITTSPAPMEHKAVEGGGSVTTVANTDYCKIYRVFPPHSDIPVYVTESTSGSVTCGIAP